MAAFLKGHDPVNDDMDMSPTDIANAQANNDARRRGYVIQSTPGYEDSNGDNIHIGSVDVNTPGSVDWDVTGGGEDIVNSYKQGGTSAWDKSVDRYRNKGAEAQGREGIQLDQSRADESRGLQMDALTMLRRQGDGTAASSADILSQRANQDAARQVGGAGLRKGGPGAAIASMNAAGRSAGDAALTMNTQNADARAGEISRGQGAYSSAALGVQGQDIGAATTNAQLQAQQRALNEAKQQRYERLAFDTRTTQLQAGVDTERNRHLNQLSINQAADARKEGELVKTENNVSSGATMMSSASSASDPRTKQNVRPLTMGSLSGLRR